MHDVREEKVEILELGQYLNAPPSIVYGNDRIAERLELTIHMLAHEIIIFLEKDLLGARGSDRRSEHFLGQSIQIRRPGGRLRFQRRHVHHDPLGEGLRQGTMGPQ